MRGEVLDQRDVTTQLDAVPLKEALEWLLRNQNFTLTYAADGKLKAIELKELREQGARASGEAKNVVGPNGERPFERAAFLAFDERERVPVGERLAKTLGDTKARWDMLGNMTYGVEDPALRRAAVRAAMQAIEADRDLHAALVAAFDGVSDADLAAFARARCYHRAEDLMRNVSRETSDPDIRARAEAVLHEGKRNPFDGTEAGRGQRAGVDALSRPPLLEPGRRRPGGGGRHRPRRRPSSSPR